MTNNFLELWFTKNEDVPKPNNSIKSPKMETPPIRKKDSAILRNEIKNKSNISKERKNSDTNSQEKDKKKKNKNKARPLDNSVDVNKKDKQTQINEKPNYIESGMPTNYIEPVVAPPISVTPRKSPERNKNTGARLVSINKKEHTVQVMPMNPFERIWDSNALKDMQVQNQYKPEREKESDDDIERQPDIQHHVHQPLERPRDHDLNFESDMDLDMDLFSLKTASSTANRKIPIGGKVDQRNFVVKHA